MGKKVVQGGELLFKEDIIIDEEAVRMQLTIPSRIPIFSIDEMQVFYNSHVFTLTKNSSKDAMIKVYTTEYGLNEEKSPKLQEDEYFKANTAEVNKLKEEFIKKAVIGMPDNCYDKSLEKQACLTLVEKINHAYDIAEHSYKAPPSKGLVPKLSDDSIFNTYIGDFERAMLLDGKVYRLETIQEYLSMFQKAIEPKFYKELEKKSVLMTPEEAFKELTDNRHKIHPWGFPFIRNKIWYNEKSFKIFLDGIYWIPKFASTSKNAEEKYRNAIERKIKTDAAEEGFGK
ncbi:hypothetical protein FJZ53_02880 [Candidatus Woesearchaeota archaeon]|nr:hypothetical protein [Candidatus Woesearchaeota archaeon]